MEIQLSFCRFCAEFKPIAKLYNLQSSANLSEQILLKLGFVKAICVNLCSTDTYPAAVCFVCIESLDQAYNFFMKVKQAQETIEDLLTNQSSHGPSGQRSLIDIKIEPELILIPEEIQDTCNDTKHENAETKQETDDTNQDDDDAGQADDNTGQADDNTLQDDDDTIHEDVDSEQEDDINQIDDDDDYDDVSKKAIPKKRKRKMKERDNKDNPESWHHMPWICRHCNEKFSNIHELRSHSKTTHNSCQAFKCPECHHGVKSFNGFIKHIRQHYPNLRNYCIHCNKNFASGNTAIAHSKDHLKGKTLCGYCGDIFIDEIELQDHLNLYSLRQRNPKKPGEGQDIADRTCKLCNKVFQSSAYIPGHMLIHQGKRQLYTCDRCGKTFRGKGSLTCHLISHNEEKKFSCKVCNKAFSLRSRLVQHVARHSDVKRFKCEECGRKFKMERQLKDHRLIHTDYMPFSCEVCGKQFRRKNNLKQHLLQHTGEKPYTCDVCDKTFTDVGNRNKHMKRVHNRDVAKRLEVIDESAVAIEEWKETLKMEKYVRK